MTTPPQIPTNLENSLIIVPNAGLRKPQDEVDGEKFKKAMKNEQLKTAADQRNKQKHELEDSEGKKKSLEAPSQKIKEGTTTSPYFSTEPSQKPRKHFKAPVSHTASTPRKSSSLSSLDLSNISAEDDFTLNIPPEKRLHPNDKTEIQPKSIFDASKEHHSSLPLETAKKPIEEPVLTYENPSAYNFRDTPELDEFSLFPPVFKENHNTIQPPPSSLEDTQKALPPKEEKTNDSKLRTEQHIKNPSLSAPDQKDPLKKPVTENKVETGSFEVKEKSHRPILQQVQQQQQNASPISPKEKKTEQTISIPQQEHPTTLIPAKQILEKGSLESQKQPLPIKIEKETAPNTLEVHPNPDLKITPPIQADGITTEEQTLFKKALPEEPLKIKPLEPPKEESPSSTAKTAPSLPTETAIPEVTINAEEEPPVKESLQEAPIATETPKTNDNPVQKPKNAPFTKETQKPKEEIPLADPLEEKPSVEQAKPQEKTAATIEAETLKLAEAPVGAPPVKSTKIEPKESKKTEEEESDDLSTQKASLKTPVTETSDLQKEKNEDEEKEKEPEVPPPPSFFPFLTISAADTVLPSYANLPPVFDEIFHKMVGIMTVLEKTDMQKTTFVLNGPQFSSSVFFGSQITIIEWKQAPKIFNIEFSGSEEAVKLFNSHKKTLEDSLPMTNKKQTKSKDFSFEVNSLSINLFQEGDSSL